MKIKMNIVVITGSRNWPSLPPIRKVVRGANLVLHGGATGADEIADKVAGKLGIVTLRFPAAWNAEGKAAGPARNERMAVWAEKFMLNGHNVRCYAFPLSESIGTHDCVKRMRAHGIPTTVYGEN